MTPLLPSSPMRCPHCAATYNVVRVEVAESAADRDVNCLGCGGPLPPRDGAFIIKYFLLDRPVTYDPAAQALRQGTNG